VAQLRTTWDSYDGWVASAGDMPRKPDRMGTKSSLSLSSWAETQQYFLHWYRREAQKAHYFHQSKAWNSISWGKCVCSNPVDHRSLECLLILIMLHLATPLHLHKVTALFLVVLTIPLFPLTLPLFTAVSHCLAHCLAHGKKSIRLVKGMNVQMLKFKFINWVPGPHTCNPSY
jgi:hypothetical protein